MSLSSHSVSAKSINQTFLGDEQDHIDSNTSGLPGSLPLSADAGPSAPDNVLLPCDICGSSEVMPCQAHK